MKVFLSADMEGTCGIVAWPETERSTPMDYAPYQKQMSREVAAACRGALSAGAVADIVPAEVKEQYNAYIEEMKAGTFMK